jgi:iron-sulfur cluster repair protein YtfE (RIC family)
MDALELLKEDHQKVKNLFQQAEDAEGDELEKICEQIKTELEMHAHIEETIFYPAMEKYDELKEMVQSSREEHQEIKTLLQEMSSDENELESQLEELMEVVEHHAEDEEEGEMFPKIRELVDAQELDEIGQQLQTAKTQNQSQRKAVG